MASLLPVLDFIDIHCMSILFEHYAIFPYSESLKITMFSLQGFDVETSPTDASGNKGQAIVEILFSHDRGEK